MMIKMVMDVDEKELEDDVRESFVYCCGRKVEEVAMVVLSSGFMEGSSQHSRLPLHPHDDAVAGPSTLIRKRRLKHTCDTNAKQ